MTGEMTKVAPTPASLIEFRKRTDEENTRAR
jgi:hypothetical protein